ncbi:MAG: hypothetical protein HY677_04775 [Chloroflexi bacterium]|nr:hypothetical protein [Chloroflexota bacterium]
MKNESRRRFVCFDLEGPLSPQDNAFQVMRAIPRGQDIFQVISRYDDILVLEPERRCEPTKADAKARLDDYQPGDTLALIIPSLILHRISEEAIASVARECTLVSRADSFVRYLHERGVTTCCITTSYEQHAYSITDRAGVPRVNVACTGLPLDSFASKVGAADLEGVRRVEVQILSLASATASGSEREALLKERLDRFFWDELAGTPLGEITYGLRPIGGQRKVLALKAFSECHSIPLDSMLVIGDSITDRDMLRAVDEAGGVSVAFNANAYALSEATMSLASTHLNDLELVWESWAEGGRRGLEEKVNALEACGGSGQRAHFQWLAGRREGAMSRALPIHAKIRRLVREEAGNLG